MNTEPRLVRMARGYKAGVADERARCIKVLEDLRGSRLWTSLALDAINEALEAVGPTREDAKA